MYFLLFRNIMHVFVFVPGEQFVYDREELLTRYPQFILHPNVRRNSRLLFKWAILWGNMK